MTVRITKNLCTSTSAQVKLFPPADQGACTLTIDSTEGTSDPGEQSESNAPISAPMGGGESEYRMPGCRFRVFSRHAEMPGHSAGHLDSTADLNLGAAALCLPFGPPGLCLSLPLGLPFLPIVWAIDSESFQLGVSFGSSRLGIGLPFGPPGLCLSLPTSHDLVAITGTINPFRTHLGLACSSASVGLGLAFGPTRLHLSLPLGTQLVDLSRRSAPNDRTGHLSIRGIRHERRHRECAHNEDGRRDERCQNTFHCELLT